MRNTIIAIAAGLSLIAAGAALAQTPAQKAAVDSAKSAGVVGEMGDGYLGFVSANGGDPALAAAVAAINAGRAEVYAETAAKTGVTTEAAGQATARQLYSRIPAGHWYKPLGGSWTTK